MTSPEARTPETSYHRDPQNMMWLFGQFVMIPVAVFVYSAEMLLRTMQGLQQITNQGLEVMVGPNAFAGRMPEGSLKIGNTNDESTGKNDEEENTLSDNNHDFCNPDQEGGKCLILWRYKVLFVKRDLEYAFPEQEDLVPDDVPDITAWKIAEFIQQLGNRKVPVPGPWVPKQYPIEYWRIDQQPLPPTFAQAEEALREEKHLWLIGLPENDKKFLRLYSQELARYTREKPRYAEEQIDVLKQIRDRIRQ